jgi:hypothetical protein
MTKIWENDPIVETPTEATGSVMMPKVPYSGIAEGVRSLAQGPTFGFADELEAALRSGSISSPEYEAIRNRLRQQQKQFGYDYPVTSTSLEIGGALATPLAGFKLLGRAAPAVQEAITGTTTLGQIGRGTALGATTGALTGAGTAEQDVGRQTITTGVVGGVLGGGLPVGVKYATGVVKNILTASGIGDQPTAASKLIADALRKDKISADEANAMLMEMERIGVPRPVLADIGKNLQDLAYSSYVIPSSQKSATANFLESRLIDQPNDIVKGLVDKAGLGKNVNGYEYLTFLAENQQKSAAAKYPKAYNVAVDARDFRKYVDRPVFAEAYQEAQRRAGVYGQNLPDLEQIRNAQFVPTNVLHQIKIGLDRVVESNTDKVTGKVSSYGRDVSNVRREFNDLIKEKNPDYARANKEFADNERIKSAFETGQKYQKLEYKEQLDKLKKMNDSEKEAFRLGMMADVNSRLDNFKGGDFTRQIFKSDKQKSLLRYAFTDEAKYKEFVNYVDALAGQSKTAKGLMGGSQTGERLAISESSGKAAQLAQTYATSGMTGAALDILRQAAARTKGISSETAAELQKRLFAADPAEKAAIIAELNARQTRQPRSLLPSSAATGTLTGLLGN